MLLHIAEHDQPQTAKELASAFGLTVPTAYHLLNTLVAEELLAKDSSRRFQLGPQVGLLSDAFARELSVPEYLLLPLRQLAEETGETTYLSAWRGGEIVILAALEGSQAVRVASLHTGHGGHAHARASGKLLLALARPEVRDAYLDARPLEALTANTICDRTALGAELERIAARGHSVEEEEFRAGVGGVSAPVQRGHTLIAAFTVSAPIERFRVRRDELTRAVRTAADMVTGARPTG
jgi:DNA-binding IclR family transcriptional regulator